MTLPPRPTPPILRLSSQCLHAPHSPHHCALRPLNLPTQRSCPSSTPHLPHLPCPHDRWLTTDAWPTKIFQSSTYGVGKDNPVNAYGLTNLQKSRSVYATMEGVESFRVRHVPNTEPSNGYQHSHRQPDARTRHAVDARARTHTAHESPTRIPHALLVGAVCACNVLHHGPQLPLRWLF
jgi:hypothetical protein